MARTSLPIYLVNSGSSINIETRETQSPPRVATGQLPSLVRYAKYVKK